MAENLSRADFFNTLFQKQQSITMELEEKSNPLTFSEALHLTKRLCVHAKLDFVNSLVGKTARQAVEEMIANSSTKPAAPYWLNDNFPDPNINSAEAADNHYIFRKQNEELQWWWIDRFLADTNSPLEKLVFFWHNHFTTQYNICNIIPAQLMYRQNQLFRESALGNLEDFLVNITLDGAMLMYLNGNENRNESPNENYARELMELYSTGIGQYTEEDVRAGARILTGWRINAFRGNGNPIYKPFLQPQYVDTTEKVFMGTPFKVDYAITEENVKKNAIHKLIKTILSQRADAVASFIASKMYRFYVYSKPITSENTFLKELAASFKSSGFNLKTLFLNLVTSTHFFEGANQGVQIVSPLESFVNFSGNFPETTPQINGFMKELGLELLAPPNVAGWTGYRSWVTTKSLPLTIKFTHLTLEKQEETHFWTWASKFSTNQDAYKLTESIAEFLLGRKPSEKRLNNLTEVLLSGAPYYEWPEITRTAATAGSRIKTLLRELVRTPEFYLR